ncbi:MAG: hypothetical protein QF736_02215 [Candidatus Thalassarchaeaceae archaeon]|nr:hypothetical protein [Candidatus Thalassarchaeaceae archaeon]
MEDPYEWMMEPKKWLILALVAHTGLGVIVNANAYDGDIDGVLATLGFLSLISVFLAYAAFMTEGREQARLAVVICGPVFVWFIVCMAMGLEFMSNGFTMGEIAPALMVWGMPALVGVLNWNN